MRKLPEGWRIVDMGPEKIAAHLREVSRISKELAEIPRIKRELPTHFNGKPIETLSPAEREEFYFSQQPESTKAAILRQKERKPQEDIDYLLRPMPACLANPDAKSLDELTAKRQLDPLDVILHQSARSNKNTLGQSTLSSAQDRRDSAIEAFTYSKPATLSDEDLRRITKSEPTGAIMAAEPEVKIEHRPSLTFRISSWLFDKTGIWWW